MLEEKSELEKLDDQLYKARYGIPITGSFNEIWTKIKNNKEILREAVKTKRNKWNTKDIVKGITISESMLLDYENIDQSAYNELIKSIYTNKDIARIVIDGASNGGYSFLLISLYNHNLKLTDDQKAFAVNEAMNKIGTTRDKAQQEAYSKKLDDQKITDELTTTINIDGCINPIGAKTKSQYINNLLTMMSDTQVHGRGFFDIRYHILRNPNWTLEEKQKLIMDFWYDNDDYDEYLEQWEWSVVNDNENYKGELLPPFDKYDLFYTYTYEMLLEYYQDKKTTDRIWQEIQFCKQIHKLRPQQWEQDSFQKKKI